MHVETLNKGAYNLEVCLVHCLECRRTAFYEILKSI